MQWDIDYEAARTCGVGRYVDFWFLTRGVYLETNITEANLMYIDVEAQLTHCFDPRSDSLISCYDNSFQIYLENGEDIYHRSPTLNELSHLHNISNGTSPGALLSRSKQTFSFRSNFSQAAFVIRSRGACGKIYRMKLYYYACEEMFVNLVRFQQTRSPDSGFTTVTGNCLKNSLLVGHFGSLIAHCHSNGSWTMDKMPKCVCSEGNFPYSTYGCQGEFKSCPEIKRQINQHCKSRSRS